MATANPFDPNPRPTWGQLLDLIARYNTQDVTRSEQAWLRGHPTDWIIGARYLSRRAEWHNSTGRKHLRAEQPNEGEPQGEYLGRVRENLKLEAKRQIFMQEVDAQVQEAKYILGYDRVHADARADIVLKLVDVRRLLMIGDTDAAVRLLDHALVYLDPSTNPI